MLQLLAAFDGNLGPLEAPSEAFQPDLTKSSVTSSGEILEKIISNTIGTITIVAGLAFLLFFVFGALQWILAGGDSGKIDQAKKQMTNGAIGLIIIIVSYAVIGVIAGVVGIDILNPACEFARLGPSGTAGSLGSMLECAVN